MRQSERSTAGFDVCINQLSCRLPLGAENPDATGYLEIAQGFCPYIRPAMEAQVLFQSQYSLAALRALSVDGIAAEGLLYVGIVHTEWLRLRRAACDPRARQLVCDTIVLTEDDQLSWERLAGVVMWPHWILKYLYSSAGIMFANFWRGYASSAADGRDIPSPPATFVAIRSAVPPRDSRFLTPDPAIAALIRDSGDEGQNVHLPIAPVEVSGMLSAAGLSKLRYFDRAKLWSRDLLPEAVRHRTADTRAGMDAKNE
jgi:hypothetical protein